MGPFGRPRYAQIVSILGPCPDAPRVRRGEAGCVGAGGGWLWLGGGAHLAWGLGFDGGASLNKRAGVDIVLPSMAAQVWTTSRQNSPNPGPTSAELGPNSGSTPGRSFEFGTKSVLSGQLWPFSGRHQPDAPNSARQRSTSGHITSSNIGQTSTSARFALSRPNLAGWRPVLDQMPPLSAMFGAEAAAGPRSTGVGQSSTYPMR